MALELEISLDRDVKDFDVFFTELKFRAVTLAARQAINRAGRDTKSMAIKEIRKRRNLKLKDLRGSRKGKRRGRVTFEKATGTNITQLEGRLNFSGIPLPMLLFLIGKKEPKSQTKANPKRKSRRFQILKGKKVAKKGLFVQRAKRGSSRFQVFRRNDPNDKTKGFKMQSAPSVAEFLRNKGNVRGKIENFAIATLQREYSKALQFQLDKLKL